MCMYFHICYNVKVSASEEVILSWKFLTLHIIEGYIYGIKKKGSKEENSFL